MPASSTDAAIRATQGGCSTTSERSTERRTGRVCGFYRRHRLSQCSKCLHWFSRLISHSPKCHGPCQSSDARQSYNDAPRSTRTDSSGVATVTSSVSVKDSHTALLNRRKNSLAIPNIEPTQLPPAINSPAAPLSSEDQAWQFVSSLSLVDILRLLSVATVQGIPSRFQAEFRDCAEICLKKVCADPSDKTGWKLLLLLPRMLLCRSVRPVPTSADCTVIFRLFAGVIWHSATVKANSDASPTRS